MSTEGLDPAAGTQRHENQRCEQGHICRQSRYLRLASTSSRQKGKGERSGRVITTFAFSSLFLRLVKRT